jgi:tRNA U55 pseudouridine synthase TruB
VRAIAQAIGGHCTTLRRTAVGPFDLDEAAADVDRAELMPAAVALARLPPEALERVPAGVRAGVLALDDPMSGSAA